jgi:hypothetical protein
MRRSKKEHTPESMRTDPHASNWRRRELSGPQLETETRGEADARSADFQVYQYLPKSSRPVRIFRSADFQSAVSQNCILRTVRAGQTCGRAKRHADCKSAIRQSAILRCFGCGAAELGCVAGFQTRGSLVFAHDADLEIGDTAGLETCATSVGHRLFVPHPTQSFV